MTDQTTDDIGDEDPQVQDVQDVQEDVDSPGLHLDDESEEIPEPNEPG